MYAVIKTGGKQYRVQPGDLMVVEKLDGEPGAKVAFGDVLMLGDGDAVTVGAPTVDGASVAATLIETRKGEKIKVFKKIRRQGYRRTKGHRQLESVLRVVGITAGGKETKWDGKVDLTPKAELDARARGLAVRAAEPAKPAKKAAPVKAEETLAAAEAPIVEAEAATETKAPAKKAAAPKTEAKAAPAKKPAAKAEATEAKAAPKKAAAKADDGEKKAAPKKAAAKKDSDKA
ncbi:MAG: 50S ribosomal protein L21 [Caulobacteraceae bacterium]|nr:50S ribosomal protein L21 [Caulobacteraceae bacterium]